MRAGVDLLRRRSCSRASIGRHGANESEPTDCGPGAAKGPDDWRMAAAVGSKANSDLAEWRARHGRRLATAGERSDGADAGGAGRKHVTGRLRCDLADNDRVSTEGPQ